MVCGQRDQNTEIRDVRLIAVPGQHPAGSSSFLTVDRTSHVDTLVRACCNPQLRAGFADRKSVAGSPGCVCDFEVATFVGSSDAKRVPTRDGRVERTEVLVLSVVVVASKFQRGVAAPRSDVFDHDVAARVHRGHHLASVSILDGAQQVLHCAVSLHRERILDVTIVVLFTGNANRVTRGKSGVAPGVDVRKQRACGNRIAAGRHGVGARKLLVVLRGELRVDPTDDRVDRVASVQIHCCLPTGGVVCDGQRGIRAEPRSKIGRASNRGLFGRLRDHNVVGTGLRVFGPVQNLDVRIRCRSFPNEKSYNLVEVVLQSIGQIRVVNLKQAIPVGRNAHLGKGVHRGWQAFHLVHQDPADAGLDAFQSHVCKQRPRLLGVLIVRKLLVDVLHNVVVLLREILDFLLHAVEVTRYGHVYGGGAVCLVKRKRHTIQGI